MGLEAQELSCLWVGRGRAELPPVAWEVGEAVEIARSPGQSCTWQEPGRQRSSGISCSCVASAWLEVIPRSLLFLPQPLSARAQLRLLRDRPLHHPQSRLVTLDSAHKFR